MSKVLASFVAARTPRDPFLRQGAGSRPSSSSKRRIIRVTSRPAAVAAWSTFWTSLSEGGVSGMRVAGTRVYLWGVLLGLRSTLRVMARRRTVL